MKNLILVLVIAVVTACSSNGKKAVTTDAKDVEKVVTEQTIVYDVVSENSTVAWRASHLGGVQKRFGKVALANAKFSVNKGLLANAYVQIAMNTLTVENFETGSEEIGKLTGHLKSADFFNIDTYPTVTFELTKTEKLKGSFNSRLTGNLTILNVTKSVSFNANTVVSEKSVNLKSEDFTVNRTDWGLKYNTEGTKGVPVDYLISNDIGFTIDISVSRN